MPVAKAHRKVHPQLATHQAAVEYVVGILLRLHYGLEDVLSFIKVLWNSPLLEANHHHLRGACAVFEILHDECVYPLLSLDGPARERIHDAPDVDVFHLRKKAHHVEEEALDARIAERKELRVLRAGGLVVYRVEDDLAAVDANARQPLDLAVELRRDARYKLLLLG